MIIFYKEIYGALDNKIGKNKNNNTSIIQTLNFNFLILDYNTGGNNVVYVFLKPTFNKNIHNCGWPHQ